MKGDKRLGEVVNATMVVVRALLVISYVHTVILLCVQPHPRFNLSLIHISEPTRPY